MKGPPPSHTHCSTSKTTSAISASRYTVVTSPHVLTLPPVYSYAARLVKPPWLQLYVGLCAIMNEAGALPLVTVPAPAPGSYQQWGSGRL